MPTGPRVAASATGPRPRRGPPGPRPARPPPVRCRRRMSRLRRAAWPGSAADRLAGPDPSDPLSPAPSRDLDHDLDDRDEGPSVAAAAIPFAAAAAAHDDLDDEPDRGQPADAPSAASRAYAGAPPRQPAPEDRAPAAPSPGSRSAGARRRTPTSCSVPRGSSRPPVRGVSRRSRRGSGCPRWAGSGGLASGRSRCSWRRSPCSSWVRCCSGSAATRPGHPEARPRDAGGGGDGEPRRSRPSPRRRRRSTSSRRATR